MSRDIFNYYLEAVATEIITGLEKTTGNKPADESSSDMSSSFGGKPRLKGGEDVITNIEREEINDPLDPGANGVFSFRYQFPINLDDDIAIKRRLLGLDGAEPAPFSQAEKGKIATKLRSQGFLTNAEIQMLGGKIVKTEYLKV